MNRIKEIGLIVNKLLPNKLLDVGCRDCILESSISDSIVYYGCDLYQNEKKSVDFVGDILSLDLPEVNFDCVTAIDILEHTDDPYTITDKLFNITDSYLIVNLPNCYDLKGIYKFVIKGHLGGKYKFEPTNQLDRHRWVMNVNEILNFYKYYADKFDCELTIKHITYGGGMDSNVSNLFAILVKLLPARLITSSVVGVFRKK
jgi:hypothetical protein